ncbi:hypothetical protein BC832DRAFT_556536 [Gaertneriomyces semiglobifer]|nr:hypothetical protein BC832DRAFT_556536 [Gaertneriomyces semiglobifer]
MSQESSNKGNFTPTPSQAESSGTNASGNHYCTRGPSEASGGAYHYSNSDGSYYYQNTNGSTYYSDPSGNGHYTAPSDNPRYYGDEDDE